MTATLEPWADEVYDATVEPRRRGPVRRALLGALDLWCASAGGRFDLTRAADVVVRRRADGVEELRVAVPDPDDTGHWLALVRDDLLDLDPTEFRAAWGIA